MPRHLRTRPLTIGKNDRAHVLVNLTADEAREIEAASTGLPVATWCRWAVLSTARLINSFRPEIP